MNNGDREVLPVGNLQRDKELQDFWTQETNRLKELLDNAAPKSWLDFVAISYLTDFDGKWDFEKYGPLGVIEVIKQDIK